MRFQASLAGDALRRVADDDIAPKWYFAAPTVDKLKRFERSRTPPMLGGH